MRTYITFMPTVTNLCVDMVAFLDWLAIVIVT
jgi:hypothetical protein